MKLTVLFSATMFVFATSEPVEIPRSNSSDFWVHLNLNGCCANPVSFSQSSLDAQKDTAKAVIDGYNEWDIEKIMAYRTPECQHQVLPSSMGQAAKSNNEYRAYLSTIMPLYSNFTATVLKEIHDVETHTCTIHASSMANTQIGQYHNEYALILTFTEDGKQVAKFEEFVDSAYSDRFVAALKKSTSSHS